MTTAITPTPTDAPTDGFDAPAAADTKPAAQVDSPKPADSPAPAPAKAEATPAAPAAPAAPSLIEGAAATTYDLKAEGVHADDLKTFASVLGEHKVDGKVGQAILDKMLPALSARREATVKAQWDETQKSWRDENAKDPEIDPAKPENQARTKLALDIAGKDVIDDLKAKGLTDLPAFNRLVARFGAFVQKATKQDSAISGNSPQTAPKHKPEDLSAGAFAAGFAGSTGF
jgi:hypothetical protein